MSPGPGVCNVLGTAVTLAMVAEVLGFALPGSLSQDAGSDEQAELARQTGAAVVRAVTEGVRPRSLVTRQALLDAWRVVCALGGSTNAAIHLLALAGRAGVDADARRPRRRRPQDANPRPGQAQRAVRPR